ncbi:hypothetical protein RHOSPDRAFT_26433 [Rhodotorula sp. JG-1b]|nr:hypothetical protein RHOSPDRAFT_26433 [Rhodotorula sp. JG-1b]
MDKCLDAWANNLTKALSAPLPEEVQWSAAQYEAVYVKLWVLVKETWLGRNSSDLGSHPESREQLVKSVLSITPKYLWDTLEHILEGGQKDTATRLCNMTLKDFCTFIQNEEKYPWNANFDVRAGTFSADSFFSFIGYTFHRRQGDRGREKKAGITPGQRPN